MTYVSNDPSYWPDINLDIFVSYWTVAAGVVVVYNWVLTLGQEIELIWYVSYAVFHFSDRRDTEIMPSVLLTDAGCVALTAMLGVIMIARLHAMYQGSRKMLIFLVIIFLAVNIACGVIAVIVLKDTVGVWIAVKHFRELRRLGPSTGSTIGDCFTVLIQSHAFYFASFVGVSCLQLANISPEIWNLSSIGVSILGGAVQILLVVQLFVLGPRLILSVREYHAKLVAYSDAETSMNLIVFQEHVHVSTSSTV
ncbi:uncharacterized protein F5147DRAFT_654645 [Suillus discolor]|uniref:Uncharacterized protein n=1 Tax=Suillus discolor TaxID=1912936 RepID=A0A9P7JS00_9AGAM|nr:uncharacterized protein F5147DRAFT_654645 [Suillus discolor]KAG2103738.1 hypothetical protein F5147DRAFT_654645 [Suillus discolor]